MKQKGSPKTGGRAAGTPNKVTSDLRRAVSDLIERNWERIQGDMDALEPKDRLMFIEKLLSYSLPKLSSVTQETTLRATLDGMTDEQLTKMALEILNKNKDNGTQNAIN